MMRIAVVDGQGGGIGSTVVKRLREKFGADVEILALGTNSAATSAMMKARANKGATGENAIIRNTGRVDVIVGPLSIVLANGMLGELTPGIAEAIASSMARKILLPVNQEGVEIAGIQREPLPHLIEKVVEYLKPGIRGR
jgi:NAD(P)-dependent dehydrogenase (short-subunit alcohol dehydrogenase family)